MWECSLALGQKIEHFSPNFHSLDAACSGTVRTGCFHRAVFGRGRKAGGGHWEGCHVIADNEIPTFATSGRAPDQSRDLPKPIPGSRGQHGQSPPTHKHTEGRPGELSHHGYLRRGHQRREKIGFADHQQNRRCGKQR